MLKCKIVKVQGTKVQGTKVHRAQVQGIGCRVEGAGYRVRSMEHVIRQSRIECSSI